MTRLAFESELRALQSQATQLEQRVRELQEEVNRSRATSLPPPGEGSEAHLTVSFVAPSDNSTVDQFVDVEFTLTGRLPAGYSPTVVVRDSLGQYWSWGPAPSGRMPRVQIGLAADTGQRFKIGVLVIDSRLPSGKPIPDLPRGLLYKEITVVRR